MKKEKQCYKVYRTERHNYCGMGVDSERTDFIGTTYAVSAAQAANNVAHRNGEKPTYVVPWWGDGSREVIYHAEEA